MTKVDQKIVAEIALLSRIDLNEAEKKKYQSELSAILVYIDTIAEVNTDGVEPASQITGLADVVRRDEKKSSTLARDEILSNAPDTKDGYIKVKSVLE